MGFINLFNENQVTLEVNQKRPENMCKKAHIT